MDIKQLYVKSPGFNHAPPRFRTIFVMALFFQVSGKRNIKKCIFLALLFHRQSFSRDFSFVFWLRNFILQHFNFADFRIQQQNFLASKYLIFYILEFLGHGNHFKTVSKKMKISKLLIRPPTVLQNWTLSCHLR